MIRRLLDSSEFRSYVENVNCNFPMDRDIDSASVITSTLGILAASFLQMTTLMEYEAQTTEINYEPKNTEIHNEPKTEKEFDNYLEQFVSQLEEEWKKKLQQPTQDDELQKILEVYKKIMPNEAKSIEAHLNDRGSALRRFAYFFAMPKYLSINLAKLYPGSELIQSLAVNLLAWKELEKRVKTP